MATIDQHVLGDDDWRQFVEINPLQNERLNIIGKIGTFDGANLLMTRKRFPLDGFLNVFQARYATLPQDS